MADSVTLAKARRELEELYLGIPDDSVNLTFGDLAEVKRKSGPLEPISEAKPKKLETSPLTKLPSLDFSKAFEGSTHRHNLIDGDGLHASPRHRYTRGENHHVDRAKVYSPRKDVGFRQAVESSPGYDEMSNISGTGMASTSPYRQGGGRKRPGIPHSNICTVCSNHTYICRQRCLVCGRAYCRQCVSIGMGEMTEGRKCTQCLGKRFSERYIQRAGQVGCCMRFRYPSTVMQIELKWAEKGPRRSGEKRYGPSTMMSRSRSPVTPRTPTGAHASPNSTPSFVMNSSSFSAYSPTTNHPLPF